MMKTRALVLLTAAWWLLLAGCSSPAAPSSNVPSVAPAAGRAAEQSKAASSQPDTGAQANWDRYVIRQADLALVVEDVEGTMVEVQKLATAAGGYLAQSNSRRDGARVLADITIQVPASAFDKTVDDLKSLALSIDSAKITSQDVTEEYVDNEANLTNLKAAEQSTLRLLDKTTRIEDILTIQRELTRIRGDIEKIEGRQLYLKRRVDMSSIAIHLVPESVAATAAGRSGWQPLQIAAVAWETSLNLLTQLASVLITLVIVFWWLIPLFFLVRWLWRRRPRRAPLAPPYPPKPIQPATPRGT